MPAGLKTGLGLQIVKELCRAVALVHETTIEQESTEGTEFPLSVSVISVTSCSNFRPILSMSVPSSVRIRGNAVPSVGIILVWV